MEEKAKFECEKCAYSGTQSRHLELHKSKHGAGLSHGCWRCDFSHNTKASLVVHVRDHHHAEETSEDLEQYVGRCADIPAVVFGSEWEAERPEAVKARVVSVAQLFPPSFMIVFPDFIEHEEVSGHEIYLLTWVREHFGSARSRSPTPSPPVLVGPPNHQVDMESVKVFQEEFLDSDVHALAAIVGRDCCERLGVLAPLLGRTASLVVNELLHKSGRRGDYTGAEEDDKMKVILTAWSICRAILMDGLSASEKAECKRKPRTAKDVEAIWATIWIILAVVPEGMTRRLAVRPNVTCLDSLPIHGGESGTGSPQSGSGLVPSLKPLTATEESSVYRRRLPPQNMNNCAVHAAALMASDVDRLLGSSEARYDPSGPDAAEDVLATRAELKQLCESSQDDYLVSFADGDMREIAVESCAPGNSLEGSVLHVAGRKYNLAIRMHSVRGAEYLGGLGSFGAPVETALGVVHLLYTGVHYDIVECKTGSTCSVVFSKTDQLAATLVRSVVSHERLVEFLKGSTRKPKAGSGSGPPQKGSRKPKSNHCFAFLKGDCRRGENCRFSHEKEDLVLEVLQASGKLPKGRQVQAGKGKARSNRCYAFLRGNCKRGRKCRFAHEDGDLVQEILQINGKLPKELQVDPTVRLASFRASVDSGRPKSLKSSKVCRSSIKGKKCRFFPDCKFTHAESGSQPESLNVGGAAATGAPAGAGVVASTPKAKAANAARVVVLDEAEVDDRPQQVIAGQDCSCGHVLKPGSKFCPRCGTKVARAATCGGCGSSLEGGAGFCVECGTRCSTAGRGAPQQPLPPWRSQSYSPQLPYGWGYDLRHSPPAAPFAAMASPFGGQFQAPLCPQWQQAPMSPQWPHPGAPYGAPAAWSH